jgi:hypothetical protein
MRDQAPSAQDCFVENCFRQGLETCTSATGCTGQMLAESSANQCVGKGVCGTTERAAACGLATGNCVCTLGSTPVGKCHEDGPFLCDFSNGCCSNFFPPGG